jgi:hypothetical protein
MKATADNLAENCRGSNCFAAASALYWLQMSEPNENPRRYKWPWFVLAAVALGIVLAIVWMSFAVHREKRERDFNAPIPAGGK